MIMVFGASGFLGAAIVNKLYDKYDVVCVTRPDSNNFRINADHTRILRVPERDWSSLILRYQPSAVICAQWHGVEKRDRDNREIQWANVVSIESLARAAKLTACEKFIALGSQAESAESEFEIVEDYLDSGDTWYGKAKSHLAMSLLSIFKSTSTQLTWVRIFTVYGPNELRDSLTYHLLQARKSDQNFVIEQPNKRWSFLFLDDFADGIETILCREGDSEIINLANPELTEIQALPKFFGLSKFQLSAPVPRAQIGYFPKVIKLRKLGWENKISVEAGCRLITRNQLLG